MFGAKPNLEAHTGRRLRLWPSETGIACPYGSARAGSGAWRLLGGRRHSFELCARIKKTKKNWLKNQNNWLKLAQVNLFS